MGEAAKAASDVGAYTRDGGAGDAREVGRRGRAARPAPQHTAARRRVWTGRTFTVTSPLSASRADEKQLPTSTEQVRERRAGVGGRRRERGRAARGRRGRGRGRGRRGRGRQEGRAAAEGDAVVVGAHGRAAGRAAGPGAAVRDGAAPRAAAAAARPLTAPPSTISRLHSIVGTPALAAPSRSIIDSVFIYCAPPTEPGRDGLRSSGGSDPCSNNFYIYL